MMRCRVVCGLSLTMLTLRPHMALTNVLLPTLGLPTRVTNPLRIRGVTLAGVQGAGAVVVVSSELVDVLVAPTSVAGGFEPASDW
jgi:hypothetical protein